MTDNPARNFGPSWGFAVIRALDRLLPEPVFRFLLHLGTTLSIPFLPERVRASRAYLERILDHPVTWRDVRRHFIAFSDLLILRFRVAGGSASRCAIDPDQGGDFMEQAAGPTPLLFGTFHLGHSDLLGFWLTDFGRTVRMVRQRMGNSSEVDWLFRRFEGQVGFIWVNDGANIPFAMRDAIAEGHSIAMQCDRPDYASKTAAFTFLGREQIFPVTIYHLALLFELPVLMAFGTADSEGGTRVHALPAFVPEPGNRKTNLERAHAHFAASLCLVEDLLRQDPYQWFNFEPAQLVEPRDG